MFDKFESRYVFKGTLALETGLHIGGGKPSATGTDNAVMKTFEGLPFIPGSSLKGVMRATLESILRGMEQHENLWACDVVSGEACISEDEKKGMIEEKQFEQAIFDNSCTICRLFGSPFLGSKLFVKDLYLGLNDSGEPAAFTQVEDRDFVAIHRDTGTAKHQGKFDAEIVPAGTVFDFEILVENPEDYELGLLFTGFDLFNEGHALLGGLASRGMGRIRIDLENIDKITSEMLLGKKDERKKSVEEYKADCTNALQVAFNSKGSMEGAEHA